MVNSNGGTIEVTTATVPEFRMYVEAAREAGVALQTRYERTADIVGGVWTMAAKLLASVDGSGVVAADMKIAVPMLCGPKLASRRLHSEVAARCAFFGLGAPEPVGEIVYVDETLAAMFGKRRKARKVATVTADEVVDDGSFVVASFADVDDDDDPEPEGKTSGARIRNARKNLAAKIGPAPWDKKADAGETINLRATDTTTSVDPETGVVAVVTTYEMIEDEATVVNPDPEPVETAKDRKTRLQRERRAAKRLEAAKG